MHSGGPFPHFASLPIVGCCKRAVSACSARSVLRCPGRVDNAATAASRATLRTVMIVDRSTPDSAATCVVVIWPVNIRNHKSYFCSPDNIFFVLRGVMDMKLDLLFESKKPWTAP